MAQLDVAGGGGSFEWLEDEPGFDAPADVGFFTLIMTATSIMNLCRTGGGGVVIMLCCPLVREGQHCL